MQILWYFKVWGALRAFGEVRCFAVDKKEEKVFSFSCVSAGVCVKSLAES